MAILKAIKIHRLHKFISAPACNFYCQDKKNKEYPEEPTTCCMSGCANCVWLEYAEKLNQYYQDTSGEEARKIIEEKVTDPNMKAFLLHELRIRKQQHK